MIKNKTREPIGDLSNVLSYLVFTLGGAMLGMLLGVWAFNSFLMGAVSAAVLLIALFLSFRLMHLVGIVSFISLFIYRLIRFRSLGSALDAVDSKFVLTIVLALIPIVTTALMLMFSIVAGFFAVQSWFLVVGAYAATGLLYGASVVAAIALGYFDPGLVYNSDGENLYGQPLSAFSELDSIENTKFIDVSATEIIDTNTPVSSARKAPIASKQLSPDKNNVADTDF